MKRNIFAVDIEAIKSTLAEANSTIEQRSRKLIDAFDRVPSLITTREEFDRAVQFLGLVKEQIKECRHARLSDESSFKGATKAIEDYFADFEKPLQIGLKRISALVGASPFAGTPSTATAAIPIVKSDSGVTVVSAPADATPSPSTVEVEWTIAGVERGMIDLESLRPYLSDHALRQAATKHLRDHGPHSLQGASYAKVAQI